MSFADKLSLAQTRNSSWLCVGLDPDPSRFPHDLERPDDILVFNRAIIDATQDLVCAYKPNLAFYLAHGTKGLDALSQTINSIPRNLVTVLDGKFGDIESSARGYARFAFDLLAVDAVTLSPFLGSDSLTPFVEYAERGVFILCHTSNPGAQDLQDRSVDSKPMYLQVAELAGNLHGKADVGLVVGATFPEQLKAIRENSPESIFLIPGVGAQGGGLAATARFGKSSGGIGPLINVSRSVLYASSGSDFAQQARSAASKLRDEINALVPRLSSPG